MKRPSHSAAPRLMPASLGLIALAAVLVSLFSCGKKSAAPTAPTGPVCQVVPTTLTFGSVAVGASAQHSFQITNSGTGTLTGSVSASCSAFSVLNAGGYSLTAGQSATFTVRYAPIAGRTDTCHVATSGPSVLCLGTGLAPACEAYPETLAFYRSTPDQRIAFILHNLGSARVSGVVHSSSPEFAVLFDSTYSLGAGEDKLFQVSFKPSAAGLRTASIATGLHDCSTVLCTGIGPRLVVSPATLDLGDSWDRIDKPFTLTNADSFPLSGTITAPCGLFGLVGSTTYNLAPGQSLTDTVRYFPPNVSGTQDCQFDLGITTAGVRCHGVSQALDAVMSDCAAPTTNLLDFGTVTVGQSAARTLTILDGGLPDPNAPLCSGVLLDYSSELLIDGNAQFSNLTPSQRVDFTVTVTPTVAGMHHILIQSWSWNASLAHQVGAYVECRVRAMGP